MALRLVLACCLPAIAWTAVADDWVRPNDPAYRRYPQDPHQESLFLLNMEQAWKLERGAKDLIVGVVDLAFDPSHPDLKNKLWTNPKEIPGNGKDDDGNGFVDDLHGWDFEKNDATLDGPHAEHGNHVAGIIGAETNNGLGIAGMAPNCRLMLVKVGLAGCLRDGKIEARGVRYCADNGARLICVNHGLSEYYPGWHVPVGGELKEACDYAYRKGALVISGSSSNDGVFYPAVFQTAYDSVMGTGASDILGKPSNMFGGSNFCEVIAPGGERKGGDSHGKTSIYSCYAGNRLYHYYAGGCMATPHVVGLMALVLSHYPGIDVEQARQIVRNTAKSGKPALDPRWGCGLIQPVAALSLTKEQIAPRPELEGRSIAERVDDDRLPCYVVRVRNTGALDAKLSVALVRGADTLATREEVALGLRTTEVFFPRAGLPPARELSVKMQSLGMARPRVYDDVAEVRLRIGDGDVRWRPCADARQSLVAEVHNAGTTDASRVLVWVHEHEPAVAKRTGRPSRGIASKVISVPARGSAQAEFPAEQLPTLADLWVEIEQLDVGAPHVARDQGKARASAPKSTPAASGAATMPTGSSKTASSAVPGTLETNRVVRLLTPNESETFFCSVDRPGTCRLLLGFLEASESASVEVTLESCLKTGEPGALAPEAADPRAAARGSPSVLKQRPNTETSGSPLFTARLTRQQAAWEGKLDKGSYRLDLKSRERIAYTIDVVGADSVRQAVSRATDRGAGAKADYTAWLSTPAGGKTALQIYNCSEGARLLFLPEGGKLQTISQTGGVMGDSSVQTGGAGVWRDHAILAGPAPAGAWLYYPSAINACGDYAVRGNFTIHWRRPPDAVREAFARSPTMRAMQLKVRGEPVIPASRPSRYAQAADAGLKFMQALTEPADGGCRIYERWYVDQDSPRVYWGNDGQMLCARTYYQAYQATKQEKYRQLALGIAHRVIRLQNLDTKDLRYGAIPYGLVGKKEKVSWGSSNNIQGKILYGLAQLASWSRDPKLLAALKLNADYYARVQYPDGRWPHFVERMPKSVCGYATAWGVSGLLVAHQCLGEKSHLQCAERALAAFAKGRDSSEGLRPDGSILCHCNHASALEDDHAIRSSLTMLTPYALAYSITKNLEYRKTLDDLYRFLSAHLHATGVIKMDQNDCVNLIYAQNWGPQGFCEAYEATGERKFLDAAMRMADFFARAQLVSDDPHYHGAWVGSYNVAKDFPGGNVDDEGNLYDLYTSWGAAPIVYGFQRLAPHVSQ